MSGSVDPAFLALPLDRLADAALSVAGQAAVTHAEFRLERTRAAQVSARDGHVESDSDGLSAGLSVRVLRDGTWGFAATSRISVEDAAAVAGEALEVARTAAALSTERVELAPEPVHVATWTSSYETNPFALAPDERAATLIDWTARLLSDPRVAHADARVLAVQEDKFYADAAGTRTTQERVRVHPAATAVAVDDRTGAFETMRTVAPPCGRGWEYVLGTGWDWDGELGRLPELLDEKLRAQSLEPGPYDVVIDPTNLWLTIHESIGHATELDRALGYEAAYAGTSFATFDRLGSLRYGSPVMHVTGDRTVEHGLATVAFDDEGVESQEWDLVRDGVLVGYQLNRAMAARQGFARSNGCAFADSAGRVPLQRMANVSLRPAPSGPSTPELIAAVDDGLYIVGDRSWSIDMQRYNFQFTGQRFYRIRHGRLVGQCKDLAYQGVTTEFWGSMEAVGGEETYLLGGAFNCGKGQPGQVAAVSHGCPSALFRQVRILNTSAEAGR
ncbi:MAG: TldD/PmbA family protein [Acidobacteriota bacterium]|nr:TldD/PmbA family protein [Acidobacteriota bacterium]